MKINQRVMFLFIILVAIIFLNYTFSFAKYISNSFWDYYLKSKSFYFTSDYLATNPPENINNLWDGNAVSFNLKNSINQLSFTKDDINYEVECNILGEAVTLADCHLNDSASNKITGTITQVNACINTTSDQVDVTNYNETDCKLGGYSWELQPAINNLYFSIVPKNQQSLTDIKIEIIATSLEPYRQTISGYFSLHYNPIISGEPTLTYQNHLTYNRLIITNPSNQNQCLSLSWDATKLAIDANQQQFINYTINENDDINQIKLNMVPNSNQSYLFYSKDQTSIYSQDDFTLNPTTGC